MDIPRKGDVVRIIADDAGHGISKGRLIRVSRVEKINIRGPNSRITHQLNIDGLGCFVYNTDVEIVRPINPKKGKYIITDPEMIMNPELYKEIKENNIKYHEADFENQNFPLKTTDKNKNEIIIHKIEKTPYGPGEYIHETEYIKTRSGMLCIAEKQTEWKKEEYGAIFETLEITNDIFPNIINKF